jgi:hypothetical protein
MVGIIDLLGQCKLQGAEERDPQQWYKCTSTRLRGASTSIKALLASPYFAYMNNPRTRTAEIYSTLVDSDPPIEGETDPNHDPKANFQKIPECQRQNPQMLFSAILVRFTEIKARLMDDPNISRLVSETPTPSGLTARIRDGKPSSPHRKLLGNGRRRNTASKQSAADLVSPSPVCSCERDAAAACRTALKS